MNVDNLRNDFNEKASIFSRLRDEALFTIDTGLKNTQIKLHSTSSRIKDFDSFVSKVHRSQSSKPFEEIHDIVGIRVVCLFLSDIERIGDVIRSSFDVLEEDNRIEGS